MEVSVTIDENLFCLIKSSTKNNISSIMTEALNQWAKQSLHKCPVDENYCLSKEPCNDCMKLRK